MDPLAPTSIKSMPPELLTHIFQFAHGANHCLVTEASGYPIIPESALTYPKQPHTLSHVCSTCRRVALATRSLWSHIDIVIDHELNDQSLARAKLYAQRAGQHSLEIHLFDANSKYAEKMRRPDQYLRHRLFSEYKDLHKFEFLDAKRVSISSLVLEFYAFDGFRDAHLAALEYFLAKCTAGVFTRYTAQSSGYGLRSNISFRISQNSQGHLSDILDVHSSELEEPWLAVEVVKLDGPGPPWASKLYHGISKKTPKDPDLI